MKEGTRFLDPVAEILHVGRQQALQQHQQQQEGITTATTAASK